MPSQQQTRNKRDYGVAISPALSTTVSPLVKLKAKFRKSVTRESLTPHVARQSVTPCPRPPAAINSALPRGVFAVRLHLSTLPSIAVMRLWLRFSIRDFVT